MILFSVNIDKEKGDNKKSIRTLTVGTSAEEKVLN